MIGLCVLAGMLPLGASAGAQGAMAKPPKRSFSNSKTPPKNNGSAALKQASQEELVDAVLGDTMTGIWNQVDDHGHIGEYNHVINLLHIVVQGDPHNMEAFSTPAYLLWSTGRNEQAEVVLQEGLDANPKSFFMYDEFGLYWNLYRKDPKAAIPYYEKAVKYDCPFLTWNSLANCYEKTNQWEKAVAAWEKGTLYPTDAVANVRLKRARARLAQEKHGP